MHFTNILSSALLAATAHAAPSCGTLEARQFGEPLGLAVFTEPNCQGPNLIQPFLPYDVSVPQAFVVRSVGLISRPLAPFEQLEFRRDSADGRFCGEVISTLPGDTPPGCYPVENARCVRLTRQE